MLGRLPEFVDPVSFAEKRVELSGEFEIARLSRVLDALFDKQGVVSLRCSFAKSKGIVTLEGTVSAELMLICQACLDKLHWPIEIHFNLAVVNSLEQANRLSSEFEPLLLEEERISLIKLVEDEVLLQLPDFPKHSEECLAKTSSPIDLPNEENIHQKRSDSPFSVLANLKISGEK